MDKRELDAGGVHQLPGVLKLACGDIESGNACAPRVQRDRPLSRSAAELEYVLAGDVAEDPQIILGHLPQSPRGAPGPLELGPVTRLIGVGLLVPDPLVAICMFHGSDRIPRPTPIE